MNTYTGPTVLTASGLALLAFATIAPSDGAFAAAWVLGIVIAGLGVHLGFAVARARARVSRTLFGALRDPGLGTVNVDRLSALRDDR